MTRGLRTGCSVCQDTTISDDASAPNCRWRPATGGVGAEPEAPRVSAGVSDATPAPTVPMTYGANAAPPPMPAAASSFRRLNSSPNVLSCVVMEAGLEAGHSARALPQLDDS